MSIPRNKQLSKNISKAIKIAVAEAIERHRRLGQPIAVWQNGRVVTIPATKIPSYLRKEKKSHR